MQENINNGTIVKKRENGKSANKQQEKRSWLTGISI